MLTGSLLLLVVATRSRNAFVLNPPTLYNQLENILSALNLFLNSENITFSHFVVL